MTKLNIATREKMAFALAKHKMDVFINDWLAESVAIFNAVVEDKHPTKVRNAMETVKATTKKPFKEVENITVNCAGVNISVGKTSFYMCGYGYRRVSDIKVEPREILNNRDWSYIEGKLLDRLKSHKQNEIDLGDQFNDAYKKALGALTQFSTAKRLQEEWPEAMPIIASLMPESNRLLPTVQVDNLNDEFGLPPMVTA